MLPKLTKLDNNFTLLELGDLSIWFSYETPIGFQNGGPPIVSENLWSKTTDKHLNKIGKDRMNREMFEKFLGEAIKRVKL